MEAANLGQNAVSPPQSSPAPAAPPPKRWGRKLLMVAGALLLVLGLLVGFAPAIISSRPVSAYVISTVNGELTGQVQLDSLSLSWGGPSELRGLRVIDPAGQEALRVDDVRAAGGLWRLAMDLMNFGEITIQSPRATLFLDKNNEITLAQAFQPRKPKPARPAEPLPRPSGRIILKQGALKIVKVGGGTTEISDLNGELSLQTLADAKATLSGMLPEFGKLQLECAAQFDEQKHRITLGKCHLASTPFSADVSGDIADLDAACNLSLKGRYDAAWEPLTKLLHDLVPATANVVVIKGRSASEFSITGPARQPGAKPAFRGMTGEMTVGWDGATLYGISLGATKLAPALREGVVTIPSTSTTALDGKVNLAGTIDMTPADPLLRINGKLPFLERVALNNELSDNLLSHINPIFLKLARIEGRVSLDLQDALLPLGSALKTAATGQGRVDLSDVKLQPGGILGELLALTGKTDSQGMYTMQMHPLEFRVKDGRILYDDLTLTFPPDIDLKFFGSVGFDDTLELTVSVPVRAALLDRLGKGAAAGALGGLAEKLSGARVEIPIVGTRQDSRLDMSKVDVSGLLKGAAPELPGAKDVGDLLNKLGGKKD